MPLSTRLSAIVLLLLAAANAALAADFASGKASFKNYSSVTKYAWLVRGPDDMDESKSVLRLFLSSEDFGAKLKACNSMSCADRLLIDGAMVDFSDARHLGYAVRLNGQRVQYSGGTSGAAFAITTNSPDRLAGKLHIDDTATGGAKVDAEFDLTLAITFKNLR